MSMYNMLFGINPNSNFILSTLELNREMVGRFRDCFVINGEIAIYTRNGGGNRDDYAEVFEQLSNHPCYLRDEDDAFDSTYATIYFKFPEQFAEQLSKLNTIGI